MLIGRCPHGMQVPLKELGRKHQHATQTQDRCLPFPPARQRPARLTFYNANGGSTNSSITTKIFKFIGLSWVGLQPNPRQPYKFINSLLSRANICIKTCTCVSPQNCIECRCEECCKEQNLIISKTGVDMMLKYLLDMEVGLDLLL